MEGLLFVMILICAGDISRGHHLKNIVLPDVEVKPLERKTYVVKTAPSCSKNITSFPGLCENDEDYDLALKDRFLVALENSNIDNDLFAGLLEGDSPSVRTRIAGDFVFENPVCLSSETLIYPRRGQTLNNEWVYLLNQDTMQQAIRVEMCNSQGSSCSIDNGEKTVCRQKYIYRKLLAMDSTGTKIVPESILAPSCCVCYRQSPSVRLGGLGTRDFLTPTSSAASRNEESIISTN